MPVTDKVRTKKQFQTRVILVAICRRFTGGRVASLVALAVVGIGVQTASAQNFGWKGNAVVSDSNVTSTNGAGSLTIGVTQTYVAGDLIQFNGTLATNNPFHTSSSGVIDDYIVSAGTGTIQVSLSPTGSPLVHAVNNTTNSTSLQFQDWLTSANWSAGIPNSNTAVAVFGSSVQGSVPGVLVNGAVTIDGLTYAGGHLLNLVSGANGTGLNTLTFAATGSNVPFITQTVATSSVFLNFGIAVTSGNQLNFPLALAGTQGLDVNNTAFATSGATTGTGLAATSNANVHSIQFTNVTYPTSFGGVTAQEGELSLTAANALGTGATTQNLTVGNTTSATAALLAGVSLNSGTAPGNAQVGGETVGQLNGNVWGRVWTSSLSGTIQTLTVGGNNATGGSFGGIIGTDFTGSTSVGSINLATTGTGIQTISGIIEGSGSVTVNSSGSGGLVLSGANSYTGTTTVTAGVLSVTGSLTGAGAVNVNAGTLKGSGSVAGATTIASGASITAGLGTTGLTLTTGALTINGTANFAVNTSTAATDEILATSVALNSSSSLLNVNDLGTTGNGTFVLISTPSNAVTGAFSGFANNTPVTVGSETYTVSYDNDAVTLTLVSTPEPGTLGLLGVGGIMMMRRRRSSANA